MAIVLLVHQVEQLYNRTKMYNRTKLVHQVEQLFLTDVVNAHFGFQVYEFVFPDSSEPRHGELG